MCGYAAVTLLTDTTSAVDFALMHSAAAIFPENEANTY
jgi:hypothetical protein